MSWLEPSCLAIVALYVIVRSKTGPDSHRFLQRLVLLVVCAWLGENTVIHAYGFYYYNPVWTLFLDQVPLMIVLIWPVVILSAHDLATRLHSGSTLQLATLTAAFVFADAWLIEPIAVQSGLWAWTQPGLFNVPPIGVLGWAVFTGLCMLVFETNDRRNVGFGHDLKAIFLAPAGTHLLLLAAWWGVLRWINQPISAAVAVSVVWAISIILTLRVYRSNQRQKVSLPLMLTRVPAATFFFVLLALYAQDHLLLILFALAFAPPYLALTPFSQAKKHA